MIISGIDEAGRGPVIGPLVIAIATIDETRVHLLQEIGVKDSKLLSPMQRERMFEEIKKFCKVDLIKLEPSIIDSAVESENTNLNWLEADTGAQLLNLHHSDKAYIDCPSSNPNAYTDYLKKKLDYSPQLVVEHKADSKYLIVGAASIIAKVTRDRAIEEIKRKYKVEFGSGYPSDPLTSAFVRENHSKYNFFRKSWATWKNAAMPKQKRLGEY